MEPIQLFPLLRSQAVITGINLDLQNDILSSRRLEKPILSFRILIDSKVNADSRSLKTVRMFIVIKQTEKRLLTPNLCISLQLIISPFYITLTPSIPRKSFFETNLKTNILDNLFSIVPPTVQCCKDKRVSTKSDSQYCAMYTNRS